MIKFKLNFLIQRVSVFLFLSLLSYQTHSQKIIVTDSKGTISEVRSTHAKLFVYRNGVKLRSGTDFVATADTVTITQSVDIPMYTGDIIEIQYIK